MFATQPHRIYPNNHFFTRRVGKKHYELTDHLGNVRATVTDRKLATIITDAGSGAMGVIGYTADITSAQDYYPFGMMMPGRQYDSDEYRYGFNGMEKDDEVKGLGNSLDFGARIYDPRIGRWLSLDPLQEKYPYLSPYHALANSPISFVDPDGKENVIYLVVLPSAKSDLANLDFQKIADKANERLSALGLKTEVRVFDSGQYGDFDARKIDATDSFVLLRSVDEIKSTVSNSDGTAPREGFSRAYGASIGWMGGKNHPEESAGGSYRLSETSLNVDRLGQGVLIDSKGIEGFSEQLGVNLEDGLVVTMLHGAAHNARGGGHGYGGLNRDAEGTRDLIKTDGIDAVFSKERNVATIKHFERNFGTKEAKENYSKDGK